MEMVAITTGGAGSAGVAGRVRSPGRPAEYRSTALIELVFQCWLERERMCAKRLVFQLESWLDEYTARHGTIEEDLRPRFLDISAASIDRILKERRDAWYARHPEFDQRPRRRVAGLLSDAA